VKWDEPFMQPPRLFPAIRLVNELSRHGFRVWVKSEGSDEGDEVTTYFVSRGGPILATITTRFVVARTVTYGDDDPILITIANRFGSVWPAGPLSPDVPPGASEVTGSAGVDLCRKWGRSFLLVALLLFCCCSPCGCRTATEVGDCS
jgi:hypothetical protein